MANSDTAIIGVQSCGCITLAIARPGSREQSKKDQREEADQIAEVVRNGGSIVHTTVGEAKADPNFLPWECPHDPKGWELS